MGAFKLVFWEPLVYTVLTSTGQVALKLSEDIHGPHRMNSGSTGQNFSSSNYFLKHLQKKWPVLISS